MGNNDRIKERVLEKITPKDITPREIKSLMIFCGFELINKDSGGSHYSYRHKDLKYILTIPMHSPIKPAYIRMVKRAIEEIEVGNNE